ncbi:MAG: hypothetical protein Q4C67_04160 [Deinococcus sp.]|nr:hypothetical protein [Deinococcus sp.]
MTKRDASDIPAEQGGLPNEDAPGPAQATEQVRPASSLDSGELLISGVNTGPAREERDSRTPTEERARLTLRPGAEDPTYRENPEADPDALADRGD